MNFNEAGVRTEGVQKILLRTNMARKGSASMETDLFHPAPCKPCTNVQFDDIFFATQILDCNLHGMGIGGSNHNRAPKQSLD